jgi:hypothetical protein
MEKFKDETKNKELNPVDWFNLFGDFKEVFKNDKNHFYKNENEVSSLSKQNEVVFTLKNYGIIQVVGDDHFDIATGSKCTKFMLFCKVRFKGDYHSAMSFVRFYLMKQEIPYIRVGTDYYKTILKENRYGGKAVLLKHWKKDEIKQDHSADFIKHIYKYDDFDIIPDNINFLPSKNSCYNLYCKFSHDICYEAVGDDDIRYSLNLMKHIFGEQINLGMKYMKLLYEFPKQILPILALVSTERGTGKTTFLNWIDMIFGENTVLISPDDVARGFNSIYATKNIIMIDETVIEKNTTVERLKSIATAKSISVSQKFVSEYSIPFFGKVILCTNKENDFMRIDEEEVRFWIRKINPIMELNTNIENNLFEEIPKFLKYLTQLPKIDFTQSRMVFTKQEIATESLEKVKTESKSGLYKDLEIFIDDHFDNNNIDTFEATAKDVKEKWFNHNNQYSISYIRKVLKDEMKLKPESLKKYWPFGIRVPNCDKSGTPFVFYRNSQFIESEEVDELEF